MAEPVVEYRAVYSEEQRNQAVLSLVAMGYTVAAQTVTETTMVKRKQFSMLWLVVGFVLCLIPLLVYLIVYAYERDSVVVIRMQERPAGSSPMPRPEHLTWTENRSHWWDGERWNDPTVAYPSSAPLTDDGSQWWDGTTWRPVLPNARPSHAGWDPPA